MTQSSSTLRLKKLCLALPLTVAGVLTASSAEAALIDRGGGLLYDTILNVTWLQDANYAKTSGFDADGKMNWNAAVAWAANLSYYDSVRNVTYTDWTLPTIGDITPPGGDFAYSNSDTGWNANTANSQLAHMFFNNLGLKSVYAASSPHAYNADYGIFGNATFNGVDRSSYGQNDVGLVDNLQAFSYWSDSSYVYNTHAWYFWFAKGYQAYDPKTTEYYAWAVRSGDVAANNSPIVPVPGAAWLLASGLIGMLGLNRRNRSA